MSAENEPLRERARKSPISLPFVVVVAILGIGAYFAAPWLMAQYFYRVGDLGKPELNDQLASDESTNTDSANETGDGGRQRGGEGGPGGGFDPDAIFARRDADNNGVLEGEELSGRMSERVAEIDKDSDGIVTKEEFLAGMQGFGGRGGSRGAASGENRSRPAADDAADTPPHPSDTEPNTDPPDASTDAP